MCQLDHRYESSIESSTSASETSWLSGRKQLTVIENPCTCMLVWHAADTVCVWVPVGCLFFTDVCQFATVLVASFRAFFFNTLPLPPCCHSQCASDRKAVFRLQDGGNGEMAEIRTRSERVEGLISNRRSA